MYLQITHIFAQGPYYNMHVHRHDYLLIAKCGSLVTTNMNRWGLYYNMRIHQHYYMHILQNVWTKWTHNYINMHVCLHMITHVLGSVYIYDYVCNEKDAMAKSLLLPPLLSTIIERTNVNETVLSFTLPGCSRQRSKKLKEIIWCLPSTHKCMARKHNALYVW